MYLSTSNVPIHSVIIRNLALCTQDPLPDFLACAHADEKGSGYVS